MTEFKLPDLGENIETAEVTRVLVSEGDRIGAEQNVLELETEKAAFELPCPHAGTISKIHVSEGDTISVGDAVLTIEVAEAAEKAAEEKGPAAEKDQAEAPAEAAQEETAEPAEEAAEAQEVLAREEAEEPAELEEEAPQPEAAIQQRAPAERAKPPEGKQPERKRAPADRAARKAHPVRERAEPDGRKAAEARLPAAAGPATRRLARELGVELDRVQGSGPGGRITRDDVKAHVRDRGKQAPADVAVPPLPAFSQWGPVERQKLNKVARTSAERLSLAWRVVPHVTQHELADITELEAARTRYEKDRPESGPKVTVTVLICKAVVAALKAFPQCNSSFDSSSGELILKRYYHIGVAVDTEHGLLVPVVRDVDQKSVVHLAEEIAELAEKARNRKLDLSDLRGGTFTVTNLGGIGGTAFTPIVNYPEVAVLGLARARWEQVIRDGSPDIRLLLPLSLSYDHRVINGADAARFIVHVAKLLSDPSQMLFEG